MVIQTNLMAMNAGRMFGLNNIQKSKSTEKLSSGYRVNRAADDAAGLAISEKMRRQIRGLAQAARNVQDGAAICQVADGALEEVHNMLHRMQELAVQSANGTNDGLDRSYLDTELQQIKKECENIFRTTSFNQRLIWEPNDMKIVGYEPKRAVKPAGSYSYPDITLDSYDIIPSNGFKVSADADEGVKVSWTDYNSNTHTTEAVDWDTLAERDYSINLSDYYGGPDGPNSDLYKNGSPIFSHTISFSPAEAASVDDIVDSINNYHISTYAYAYMSPAWEGDDTTGKFSASASINYSAAYASRHNDSSQGYNFDTADDVFIEPVTTGATNLSQHPADSTVDEAKNDTTPWKFQFYMKGIGNVTGTSSTITYSSSDRDAEDEGRWWHWYTYPDGSKTKMGNSYSASGNMKGLMSTLTGNTGLLSKTPSSGESGMNDSSGTIYISFNLTSQNNYSYAGTSSNSVGNFTLSFSVSQSDTQQSILDRVNRALNDTTILDFYKSSGSNDSASFYPLTPGNKTIDSPIYGGVCNIPIQSGCEVGNVINLTYDCLGIHQLGINEMDIKTQESSGEAIDSIKGALGVISEQRSLFGAYQNRLEHTYNINKNTEENTQYSESKIRDTDMAAEMVKLSIANILQQAGQSMIANANQTPQGVLSLLQ